MAEQYVGSDYGMGISNIDSATGMRYGVIPLNDLCEGAIEDFEPDYGNPTCPKCGTEASEYDEHAVEKAEADGTKWEYGCGCTDYMCETCYYIFDSSEAYPEEACGFTYEGEGYTLSLDSDNDVWVLGSPWYTHAQFCSPCAPGAGHLSHPTDAGPMTYALGSEWFNDSKAPYPYWPVDSAKDVYLQAFIRGYIDCLLFCGVADDELWEDTDLSSEALTSIQEDCTAFYRQNRADCLAHGTPERCGHDFWLTRNRHGAGFWDRGTNDVGRRLTDAAHVWGSVDVYVGHGGKLHLV